MHRKLRTTLVGAATAALVLSSAGLAAADDIANTLDADVDATAEVMTLQVGEAVGTTQLKVVERNGDGKNGCNLTGSTTLVIALSSSDASVATVNPSSVTFASCGATPTVTVTPVGEGTATIAASQTSNGTNGTFNLVPVTFTVNVTAPAPANTPPAVEVTGFENGQQFEIGTVVTPACAVTDAEDSNESATPVVEGPTGTLAAYGLGQVTVTCSYTDSQGLSDSDSRSYEIVDTGAPVITDLGPTAQPDGNDGWYKTAVTNKFRATDAGAGFETSEPKQLTKEFTASSGSAEGPAVTLSSGSVSDVAGNTGASIDSQAFKIDLTDPTDVSFAGDIAHGDHFPWGDVSQEPTCDAKDAVSGLAGCVVTGYSTQVGSHTLTATATDRAGRTATATLDYTVDPWDIDGFYRPVDMDKLNTVKAGSTVPLKFNVFKGSDPVTDTDVLGATFTVRRTTCETGLATDTVGEFATTGGTTLRYDADGQQWIQNWATPRDGKGNCYLVTLTTADGSSESVKFQLK